MSIKRFDQLSVRSAVTTKIALLILFIILSLVVSAWGPFGTFSWKAISSSEYNSVCYWDNSEGYMQWTCFGGCPSGSICAQFSDQFGNAGQTCCISSTAEGSTNGGECLFNVELVRDQPVEE